MKSTITRAAHVGCLLAAAGSLLGGCDQPKAASLQQPIPGEVSTLVVKPQARPIVRELPGRIAPHRVAEVRPRVSGIVVARLFRQGSEVKAGDPLYRIDPRPFEVEVMANEATLAKAEAALMQVSQQARRVALLTSARVTSEAQNEKAIASERQAKAEVQKRAAELERARLNLEYATVRAPIDGVVGAALVTEGALVVQNETNLATVQQLDAVYADFTQSVNELHQLRRAFETGDLERIASGAAKVHLVLDDNTLYPLEGKLLFSDAKVDAHTGQVTLRGEFRNPKRELLPGMYVRVRMDQGLDGDAIAVPQQAIQRNGGGGSEVFVVKDDNHIAVQPVRTGSVQDGIWFVTEGLKAGDKVVVEGFQKFAPGDEVRPQDWTTEPGAPADRWTAEAGG
ncbi:efflux RND transporter periplasmic adaptor subunit [Bradyrhizobium canariense]|uniref:efflux RND transporter periplasmic adaptor subunit n=1 Tax=Bradyrhizobium canariense TaxID=255045 RepID=UPI000A1901E7|nr:efflux RND transporter periplasmic adaptor subunit [Bradyrhizobium canariense]OSI23435.1 efflux transporter periplasmic adaptor subunit [Bradyrhizobium canariense]OSI33074.1 efflux transporter periplasmic adaptor subunit [Bradyrhizobium canariense]OSI41234.1 efflux transporter periplasmic adaptor subunit [Bradyrhizobium canariense]OSI46388.1 efflux transporter periplasmic adaptor subunit [Bradyrhizobium canariense]OSI51199.1 efflux transporter periplasmic adaptor subunit [Bradyrhizobium can